MQISQVVKGGVMSLSLLSAITAHSQETAPEWSVSTQKLFSSPLFLKQTDAGILIVSTPSSLIGISPDKKEKAWELTDVTNVEEKDFSAIDGTQYILVEQQKALSLSKNKALKIIDSYTGKVVYNSRDEAIKVRNTRMMPALGGILIEGIKDEQYTLRFLDYGKSEVLWSFDFGKAKSGGFGIGALTRAAKSHMESIFNVAPQIDATGNLIFANGQDLYALNGKTGAKAWQMTFKETVASFTLSTDKKTLFVGYDDFLETLNTTDGKSVLAKPLKVGSKINEIIPYNDAYLVLHTEGFNIYEPSGAFRWKKHASTGNTSSVWPVANGFVSVLLKEEGGRICNVSTDGKVAWDEELSQPVMTVQPIANGVIYITKERANILSYEKGKDLWKKDVKIKGQPSFGNDYANNLVYVYTNETLSVFDLKAGEYKTIAEDIKLKDFDDEKEAVKIEPRQNGVYLQTAQNIALVMPDGRVIYNKYFTEAGLSKTGRMLLGALGKGAALAGTAHSLNGLGKPQDWEVTQVSSNTYQIDSKQMRTGAAVSDAGGSISDFAGQRYRATKATKNTVFILSKWDAGTGLVVCEKDSGKELKRISFNDKEPMYVVDEADNKLYVLVKDKEVRAYNLQP